MKTGGKRILTWLLVGLLVVGAAVFFSRWQLERQKQTASPASLYQFDPVDAFYHTAQVRGISQGADFFQSIPAALLGEGQVGVANAAAITEMTLDLSPYSVEDGQAMLAELVHFPNLDSLTLTGGGGDLSALGQLSSLRSLTLQSNGAEDLSALAGLSELSSLSVSYGALSSLSGLEDKPNLRRVALLHTSVSDLSPLSSAANLDTLYLEYSNVTDLAPVLHLPKIRDFLMTPTPSEALTEAALSAYRGQRYPNLDTAYYLEVHPDAGHFFLRVTGDTAQMGRDYYGKTLEVYRSLKDADAGQPALLTVDMTAFATGGLGFHASAPLVQFTDANFDGYMDFQLLSWSLDEGQNRYWLYDPDTGRFAAAALNALDGQLTFDPEAKQVTRTYALPGDRPFTDIHIFRGSELLRSSSQETLRSFREEEKARLQFLLPLIPGWEDEPMDRFELHRRQRFSPGTGALREDDYVLMGFPYSTGRELFSWPVDSPTGEEITELLASLDAQSPDGQAADNAAESIP